MTKFAYVRNAFPRAGLVPGGTVRVGGRSAASST